MCEKRERGRGRERESTRERDYTAGREGEAGAMGEKKVRVCVRESRGGACSVTE